MQAGATCSYSTILGLARYRELAVAPKLTCCRPGLVPARGAVAYIVERDDAPVSSRLPPRVEPTENSSLLLPVSRSGGGLQLVKPRAKHSWAAPNGMG